MAKLSEILKDPNFVKADAETKKAIIEKYGQNDPDYASASDETKALIRQKHGAESRPTNWGRIGATTVGGVLGGVAAAPLAGLASVPTMGVGGVATEMAGVGLGAGLGGQAYDFFEAMLRDKDSAPPNKPYSEAAKGAVTDVAENAMFVPAGRILGEVATRAAPYVMPYVQPVLDAIPGSKAKARRLADALIKRAQSAGEDVSYNAAQQKEIAANAGKTSENNAYIADIMRRNAERDRVSAAQSAQRRQIPPPQKLEVPPNAPPAPPTRIGQPKDATAEIGKPVQDMAANEQRNIIAQRAKNDAFLRQSRNAIVAENEAKGVKITDTPSYQAIVKKAEPIANWERSGARKPDSSIAKTYKDFLGRITPETVELSAHDAALATKNGFKVRNEGGKYYRDVQPTFENIDEARRFLGEVFSGRKASEGYSALKENEQKELYQLLKNVEEEYAGRAQPRLQNNWREATAKLDEFKEGVGPKIIDAEPEKVAEMLFKNKGVGSFDEAVAATGSERVVRKALSDQLATDLLDKDAKGALAVYNSKYKQVLQNPKLSAVKQRVERHLAELRDNELAGVKTKNLVLETNARAKSEYKTLAKAETQRVQGAKENVKKLDERVRELAGIIQKETQAAKQQAGEVTKATARERIHTNEVTDILAGSKKDPAGSAAKAIQYLKRLSDGGAISTDDYRTALKEYNRIDFKRPEEARQRLVRILKYGGATATGGGALYTYNRLSGQGSSGQGPRTP